MGLLTPRSIRARTRVRSMEARFVARRGTQQAIRDPHVAEPHMHDTRRMQIECGGGGAGEGEARTLFIVLEVPTEPTMLGLALLVMSTITRLLPEVAATYA